MPRALVMSVVVGIGAVASCGRLAVDDRADASSSSEDAAAPPPSPTFAPSPPEDASDPWSRRDAAHPDGGPAPVVACDDGGACPAPPSVCLDEHWLRYYRNGTCDDAGLCRFEWDDMLCDPSPTPPDCWQGGCRVVVVR